MLFAGFDDALGGVLSLCAVLPLELFRLLRVGSRRNPLLAFLLSSLLFLKNPHKILVVLQSQFIHFLFGLHCWYLLGLERFDFRGKVVMRSIWNGGSVLVSGMWSAQVFRSAVRESHGPPRIWTSSRNVAWIWPPLRRGLSRYRIALQWRGVNAHLRQNLRVELAFDLHLLKLFHEFDFLRFRYLSGLPLRAHSSLFFSLPWYTPRRLFKDLLLQPISFLFL